MPESIDFNLLIIQGVVFLFVLWFLNTLLFKPVLQLFKKREEKTDGYFNQAENLKTKAQNTLDEYEARLAKTKKEILEIKKDHLSKGKQQRDAVLKKSRDEANTKLEDMRVALQKEVDGTREFLGLQIEVLGKAIAEKVLGRKI